MSLPAALGPLQYSDDGEQDPCGLCKDRYGVSWQVVPSGMEEMLANPDNERAKRDAGDDADAQDRPGRPAGSRRRRSGELDD